MHREILESAKFPEIVFTPMQVTGTVAAEGASKVEVSGQFRLHGQDHDVTLPVEIKSIGGNLQISDSHRNSLCAMGAEEPQQFLLRVCDKVAIEIHAAGRVVSATDCINEHVDCVVPACLVVKHCCNSKSQNPTG